MQHFEKLTLRECVVGDRGFYRRVLTVVLPIIVQNTLSNVVSLLDNVMVGQVGTLPMSAVAIVSQLIFVYNVCVWGGTAGAGIFGAQYFGRGDNDGVRHTLCFKLIVAFGITVIGFSIFGAFGAKLIQSYIAQDTSPADAAATLAYAESYLKIMLIGLVPFAITQCVAGTMRESGQTVLPMKASIAAIFVNLIFNSLLIFGLMGFPALGVVGAAIATVISRFVELGIILVSIRRNIEEYPFFRRVMQGFVLPRQLALDIMSKSLPLLANELLWSTGQAVLLQCYSVRGIQVVAAMNICSTVSQIFNGIYLSLGNATAIVVGQELGADKLTDARRTAWRMLAVTIVGCIILGVLLAACSPLIPLIYNTEPDIRALASELICVCALCMPLYGIANSAYFTIRSGGKTLVTFLFDSCFSWVVSVPVAYCLSRFTGMPILSVFFCVNALEVIKCAIGITLMKKGVWVRNIVKA